MATAKIILFDSLSKRLKDGRFPICLKITHQRKRKYFSLEKHCLPEQWNKETQSFERGFPKRKKENDVLIAILDRARDIIREFEKYNRPFSFNAFETEFLGSNKTADLKTRFEERIKELKNQGKESTASPYSTTMNAIIEFITDSRSYTSKGFKLTDIDYKFLTDFEGWLRTSRDCKDTTISVYMRTLRAIFNTAIKEKVIKRDFYPFDQYKLKERLKTETAKRSIDKKEIQKIEKLKLPKDSPLRLARDIFIFSYCTRGMNFVDIAYLKPSDIQGDRLLYIRKKTKKPFNIKLLPQAKKILDFYKKNKVTAGDYIFPIFDDLIHITEKQKFNRRKTKLREINKHLKEIAKAIGLENLKLTSYVSRHSYANALRKGGIETSKISEALGHQDEKTTRIYLKQFANTELDKADEDIL